MLRQVGHFVIFYQFFGQLAGFFLSLTSLPHLFTCHCLLESNNIMIAQLNAMLSIHWVYLLVIVLFVFFQSSIDRISLQLPMFGVQNKRQRSAAYEISFNCTGTPRERRALAMLGDKASATDWKRMTQCVVRRRDSLQYHFGLHVSKS